MKKTLTILLLFTSYTFLFAQLNNNCGNTIPVVQWPTDMYICGENYTDIPTVITNSDLPTLEYLVIRLSQNATSGNGPAVIYSDQDGTFAFTLSDIQLTPQPGEQFLVVPFAYDISKIQFVLDQYLGVFSGGSTCNSPAINDPIFNQMVSYGIYDGSSSFFSLNTWLQFSLANSGTYFSLQDFTQLFIDYTAALSTEPANCGGGTSLCFAFGEPKLYTYIPDILNYTVPHTNSLTAQASILITSSATVATSQNSTYEAPCIELNAGFCVESNANFTAIPKVFCNP